MSSKKNKFNLITDIRALGSLKKPKLNSLPVSEISKWIKEEGTVKNEKDDFNSNLRSDSDVSVQKIDKTKKLEMQNCRRKCYVLIKNDVKAFSVIKEDNSKKLKLDKPILPTEPFDKMTDSNSSKDSNQLSCPSILKSIGLQPIDSNIAEKINEKQRLKSRCLTRSFRVELEKGRDFYDIIESNQKTTACNIEKQNLSKNQSTNDKLDLLMLNQSAIEKNNVLQPQNQIQSNICKSNNNSIDLTNDMGAGKENKVADDKQTNDYMLLEKSLRELIDKVESIEEISFSLTKTEVLNLLQSSLSVFEKHNKRKFNKSSINPHEMKEVENLGISPVKNNNSDGLLLKISLNNFSPGAEKFVVTKDINCFEVIGVDENI